MINPKNKLKICITILIAANVVMITTAFTLANTKSISAASSLTKLFENFLNNTSSSQLSEIKRITEQALINQEEIPISAEITVPTETAVPSEDIKAVDDVITTEVIDGETLDEVDLNSDISDEVTNEVVDELIIDEYSEVLLINKENALDKNFIPENLINVSDLAPATKAEILLVEDVAIKYQEMYEAMSEDGITDMVAISGYRTYNYQSGLYYARFNSYSDDISDSEKHRLTGRSIAFPGTSEHQSGLAIDVTSKSIGYALSSAFSTTNAYKWIEENAADYGFIVRYYSEKTHITGIIYEPWHLRYIGTYHAQKIVDSGLCLEEYVETQEYKDYVNAIQNK